MSTTQLATLQSDPKVKIYPITYNTTTRLLVLEWIELWELFIQLPLEIKQIIKYTRDTRLSGVGYEYKEGENGVDRKEDFHLQVAERAFLMQKASETGEPIAVALVESSLDLVKEFRSLVAEFAGILCEERKILNFRKEALSGSDLWLLRLLHYFGGCEPGHQMAYRHPDKGCFTPHLYESHPGLQYLDGDRQWRDVNLSHDQTVVLPGLRLQHRTRGEVEAVYHRVIATEETAKNGRISAVCFADTVYPYCVDKERVGRTQGFPEAFNYGLSFPELDTYFRKM